MKRLIVFGASGHGKVVTDAALTSGWEVVGFGDDAAQKAGEVLLDVRVLAGSLDETASLARERDAEVLVAIGVNRVRREVQQRFEALGVSVATVVHASAVLARGVTVGAGSVVMAGAVINPDAVIGKGCIVNTGATLDHDNALGDFAHVSPGAHLGGTVTVGEGAHVGVGAAVRNNVDIGAWSVVGAGSVVVADLPERVVAYGCPARVQGPVEP